MSWCYQKVNLSGDLDELRFSGRAEGSSANIIAWVEKCGGGGGFP